MASKTFLIRWSHSRTIFSTKISHTKTGTQKMFQCTATKFKDKSDAHSTVDQSEIDHHTKQMKEWWNPYGSMKALHSYNVIRVPFVRDGLIEASQNVNSTLPLQGKTILDVGCGGGILSEPLAKLGAKVTGIDASKELIELAQQHSSMNPKLAQNKPTYICTTVEEHASTHENHYDGIVASEVIEHINNKELFVKSCVKALRPGGRIFITTPCRTQLSKVTLIWLAEYVFNAIPRGTHQIEKFTTPTELTFLLERNECQVELTYGIFYNVLTNKWQWVNYQTLMFALQAVRLK